MSTNKNYDKIAWAIRGYQNGVPYIELRPHHFEGIIDYEIDPNYRNMSGEEIAKILNKTFPRNIRPVEFFIKGKVLIATLHENPDIEIKCVQGSDSICRICIADGKCDGQNYDDKFIKKMPELEFGKLYTVHRIRDLIKRKGWDHESSNVLQQQ